MAISGGALRPDTTASGLPPGNDPTHATPGPVAAPADDALPIGLRQLVWANRVFDACASRCGPVGRWLCGPVGRTALGCVGLLLLVGALAWGLLDWIGWTW
jgi:hypothetical protein